MMTLPILHAGGLLRGGGAASVPVHGRCTAWLSNDAQRCVGELLHVALRK